jgi:hypothetical protein
MAAPSGGGEIPEWDKPRSPGGGADEDFASPLEEDDEGSEPRKRKRGKGKSGSSTYDELMKRQLRKAKLTPHRGVMILCFGLVSLMCPTLLGLIFGVLAWNWGTNDLNEMMSGRMDPDGRTLTNVGRILGLVGVCLTAALCVFGAACCVLSLFLPR